ncbi:fosfomycin resistance glutathione transferase [Pseudomonas nunensis]|uniref:Fosfomycin resistance glutathione transferase n=1 Tax=Pseudomonas nunensis TaxID=2961896 RepID=A0ABY5EA07_9PSED|nr:fosfomycin resistance glutathione transferase [Pseudomonas nunensis]KPN92322.1 glutathione transferase [Pseudomonas nunensis]MCL5227111.1 fosfomycin resistance glutathione transferase [Pseudomonas nunensis]UTO12544.1 fosfomycin resistance glutathione transferase [Pseudomonas nunensis]
MLSGLNHLTLAVTNLNRSVAFYQNLLQLRLDATWDTGAYLSLPGLWLCLSLDPLRNAEPAADYTHYAFTLSAADFLPFVERLQSAGVKEWRDNRSEGASFYFLDPDGHKLEVHVGDLASRLNACRQKPYAGMKLFDDQSVEPQDLR